MSRGRTAVALAAVVVASALVAGVGPVAAAGDVEPTASGVTVSFEPTSRTTDVGANVTYDVVVAGAADGVESYRFDVNATGTAEIVDGSLNGNPAFPNVEVAADGSSATFQAAALGDTDVTRLGSLTVEAVATGSGGLSLSDVQVKNGSNGDYAVSTGGDASLTAEGSAESVVNVTSVSGPSSATAGDVVTAEATLRNVGGSPASGIDVWVRLDEDRDGVLASDESIDLWSIDVSPGQSRTVQFQVDTTGLAPGTYTYGVVTPDDETRATLTVGAGTGFIGGTVTDGSGAAVADADVSVSAGGYSRTVENATDADGSYLVEVPAYGASEPYAVEVRADGYASTTTDGVRVGANETATVDATLSAASGPTVGFASETVRTAPGERRTVGIVAEGASDGVSGFEFEVNATGPVSIVDAEPALSGLLTDVDVAGDGSGARVRFLAQSDADAGRLATVTLDANATGEGTLSLSNVSLQSADGPYDVSTGGDAAVAVSRAGTSLAPGDVEGVVTDGAGSRLHDAAVYASTVRLDDETRVTLTPLDGDGDGAVGDAGDVDDPSDEFAVALQRADASGSFSTVASATADASALGSYSFDAFDGLSANGSTTFALYDVVDANGRYALVTPTAGGNATVEATAVALSAPARDATGTASTTAAAGGTATADVVVPTDDGAGGPGDAATGTTARVVLAGAPNGLGAYNVTVDTPGTNATLASVEGHSGATLAQTESGGAGEAFVTYRALFQSFAPTSGNVTLLTVEFSDPVAREELSMTVSTLQDENSTAIDRSRASLVLETSGGSDAVSFDGTPIAGSTNLDDDPFPEDVDGDGEKSLADVFAYGFDVAFDTDAYTDAQLAVLDYDGDGGVDLDDVFQFAFGEVLA
jgi:hypothetical protein